MTGIIFSSLRKLRTFKPTSLWRTLPVIAFTVAPSLSFADVHLYSAATLDTLWTDTIATQPLTSLTVDQYTTSLRAGTTPAPSPTPPPGPPRRGGWTPPSYDGQSTTVYFAILEISPQLETELVARQVALATYLTKSDYYQPDSMPSALLDGGTLAEAQSFQRSSAANSNTIGLRRYSARLELFLIAMVRYFAVDSISEKCAKLREGNALLQRLVAEKQQSDAILALAPGPLALEPRFAALQAIEFDVATRYKTALTEATACLVTPAISRAAAIKDASAQLEAKLNDALSSNGIVKSTRDAINQVQQAFAGLQDTVSRIDPRTNALLDLELKATNAKSNFAMVQTDALGVQPAVARMEATVDAKNISNLGSLSALELKRIGQLGTLADASAALSASAATYLDRLRKLPTTLDGLDPTKSLAPCANIPADFLSTANPNSKPVADCLQALKALLDVAAQRSTFQLELTEFSAKIQALSPEIIKDRSGR